MNLEPIIAALRVRCPLFEQRVAGAAEFRKLQENTNVNIPAAFVIPLDDNPGDQRSQNGYRQTVRESFGVVVVLGNEKDERGQKAVADLEAFKLQLFRALLGWRVTEEYDGIAYEGGSLLALDRARYWYQFEFGAETDIADEMTYQHQELEALPEFTDVKFGLDAIDPMADPNLHSPGPDGRVEHDFSVEFPQA